MTKTFIVLLLMPEVAHSREDHREPKFVGRLDHQVVAHSAARLRDRRRAGFGSQGWAVRKWKQRFGNEHRTFERNFQPRGFFARRVYRIDARGRTAADGERAIFRNERDGVGFDVLADLDAEGERMQLGVSGRAARYDLSFARIFDRQVGRLHEQSAEHLLDVELFAIHCLRIESYQPPVLSNLSLAQEREHVVRIGGTNQHFGEYLIDGLREFQVPWPVGDYDAAERRVRIGCEGLVPRAFERIGDAHTARRVVLENRHHGEPLVLELEHQVHRRADIDDVVEREFLAVKLMRNFVEAAVERAHLMRILAVAESLFTLEGEVESLTKRGRVAGCRMSAEVI